MGASLWTKTRWFSNLFSFILKSKLNHFEKLLSEAPEVWSYPMIMLLQVGMYVEFFGFPDTCCR